MPDELKFQRNVIKYGLDRIGKTRTWTAKTWSDKTWINPWTYKGGGGGGDATPHKVFLSFFPGGLTFSEAVRSSLTQSLRQV